MKATYFVLTHKLNEKYCCQVLRIGAGENIVGYIKTCNTIECLHVCETKKEAIKLAKFWEESFKDNNTYALICNGRIYEEV